MTTPKKHPNSPFCLRLSPKERARLDQLAASAKMSSGEYLRQKALGESMPKRRNLCATPIQNNEQLRLLGELGRSNVPNNLNQLAKAVNMGALLLTPEETAALLEACADIREIRQEIIRHNKR